MRRTERLFQIIQVLRRANRRPITGAELADELEVSLRTLYRDMAELLAQRVPIRGEAGMGYVLDEGYDLPPLMLTIDELEAAVLGAQWVARRGDRALTRGAEDLIAKIRQVVPPALQPVVLESGVQPISFRPQPVDRIDVGALRNAIRDQVKITIDYEDEKGGRTLRTVWPFLLGYFETVRILCAWCELRQAFRHFRTDRIHAMTATTDRYPERPAVLKRRREEEMRAAHAAREGSCANAD